LRKSTSYEFVRFS